MALSVQVLQEFYVQATRPGKSNAMSHEQASLLIESFLRFRVQETTVTLMQSALDTRDRFQISYWDAAIIEDLDMRKALRNGLIKAQGSRHLIRTMPDWFGVSLYKHVQRGDPKLMRKAAD